MIIACDEALSAQTVHFASSTAPTIQLDRRVDGAPATYVGCDNQHGMDLIAEHIRKTSRQAEELIFVGAQAESSSARERLQGFERHFAGARTMLGKFTLDWGISAAEQLINEGIRGATLVAAADIIALGLISGLRSHGIAVPGDFRVIGFDGIGPAAFAHPPLTTVRQPVEDMCASILDLIRNGSPERAAGQATPRGRLLQFKPTLVQSR